MVGQLGLRQEDTRNAGQPQLQGWQCQKDGASVDEQTEATVGRKLADREAGHASLLPSGREGRGRAAAASARR